ncbi:MAG: maleylacetoacetate isomerase [Silicimonas sp.]|nr:maleylacetoacetate isomerase [Silicimonas sp.]
MSAVTLYDYPMSSAAYRVRIGLNLAGISYETAPVNLVEGDHRGAAHLARNPQGLVPVLEIDGARLTQSLAILNYLDTTRALGLLPEDSAARARAEALAMVIAVDLHPVCNLSVATRATGGAEPARSEWMRHFIRRGLTAFETLLAEFDQAPYATGERVGLADICLIPQLFNADRWGVPLDDLPRIRAIRAACAVLPAFQAALPERVGAGR